MIRPEEPEKKKSLLDKLPKLGRVSQLMLLVGIFVILFVPMLVVYQQQSAKQAYLEHELFLLQTVLAAPATEKEALEAEIRRAEAELEAAKAVFPSQSQSSDIIDSLLELAELNDIYVTHSQVSTSEQPIGEEEGAAKWQAVTFVISLEGQAPKFQNFLLSLDDKFPTCKVRKVDITIAEEGEQDKASVTIDVFYYEGDE